MSQHDADDMSLNGDEIDNFEDDEELIEEDDDDFEVVDHTNIYEKILKEDKKTLPIMSKYEKARLIGERAQQIADGAKPTIIVPQGIKSTIEIAKLELIQRKIPLIVRRKLSKNNFEDWRIEEFEIIN